jgi:mannose-6-phosphate isomerase-like protein (cupin superfamily)
MANTVEIVKAVEVGAASVRRLSDQHEWRSTCGMRRDFVKTDKDEPVWFHYLRISDSHKHVHRRTTEYYYVTEGVGEIELDDQTVPIAKGDMIVVPPGVAHTARATTDAELHVLIIVVPPVGGDAAHDQFDA